MNNCKTSLQFVRDTFEMKLYATPVRDLFVQPLNQISGCSLPGCMNLSLPTRSGVKFHHMSSSPDVWMKVKLNIAGEEEVMQKRIKGAVTNENTSFVLYKKLKRKDAIAAGVTRIQDFTSPPFSLSGVKRKWSPPSTPVTSSLKTLIVYTHRQKDQDLSDYFLLPMPCDYGGAGLGDSGCLYRTFAPLYPKQKKELDKILFMSTEDYVSKVKCLLEQNGVDVVKLLILKCGMILDGNICVNFIVSYLEDGAIPNDTEAFPLEEDNDNTWVSFRDENVLDIDIEGVVANRFYLYPKENTLSVGQFEVLRQAYRGLCQMRNRISGQQGTYVNAACKKTVRYVLFQYVSSEFCKRSSIL